jgi:solute:Na+ symporter, SSS family
LTFSTFDIVVLVAYLGGVIALGTWMGRSQRSARDYFLAGAQRAVVGDHAERGGHGDQRPHVHQHPGDGVHGQLLDAPAGGGLPGGPGPGGGGAAARLLPGRADSTAYALLEQRFGLRTRRFASGIFMVTRAFADSVRIFAAAIPLALITGWPYWQVILLVGVATLVYTWYGGLKAVVWVDVVQMGLYAVGGSRRSGS